MALTYLELVNECLYQINEVPLNSSTFASAGGFHQAVKSAVNFGIRDINQAEHQWPFNNTSKTQTLTVGQYKYTLPSDVKIVDWDTFYLKPLTSPKRRGKPLNYETYGFWHTKHRSLDDERSAEPNFVIPTQDEGFIISPTPDEAQDVTFEYWKFPSDLVSYDDTTTIPDRFKHVIVVAALMWAYYFRENYEQAQLFQEKFNTDLSKMRSLLVNRFDRVWSHYVRDR